MSRAALRDDEIAEFRGQTVAAATRLFASRGYEGVTLRGIAAELGTSAMAPYRYFPGGKAEIFAEVRAAAFRAFAEGQERAFAGEADPLVRLLRMREAYVAFALDHAAEYRVMFALDQEPDEAWPAVATERYRSFRLLEEAVRLAVAAGALTGDPAEVAHLLWATTHGMVSLHLAGKLTLGLDLAALLAAPPLRFGG
ncbi:MAG: TetR/AcrR family transcriptional regulator [Deltaproteobacteria bacterium]|nr:TetR/AcrR family transcriptional regulator [Deltaproteobacteria bacterium]